MKGSQMEVRRLSPGDVAEYQIVRLAGLVEAPRQFGSDAGDEALLSLQDYEERLGDSFVVGLFGDGGLSGIVGLGGLAGRKKAHKGNLWGMFVAAPSRGTGGAGLLMAAIPAEADRHHEAVLLTVSADNAPAVALYRRWGFVSYGTEPMALKLGPDDYVDELMMRRVRPGSP
jgi:ribosomal protein S18 acetylase RimI-like enzyme